MESIPFWSRTSSLAVLLCSAPCDKGSSLTTRSLLLSPPNRQFDRAVELVQTLPKNGPIQSSYEEKLALYSLYKQGTSPPPFSPFSLLSVVTPRLTFIRLGCAVMEGDVSGSRPGIFELLARSKW